MMTAMLTWRETSLAKKEAHLRPYGRSTRTGRYHEAGAAGARRGGCEGEPPGGRAKRDRGRPGAVHLSTGGRLEGCATRATSPPEPQGSLVAGGVQMNRAGRRGGYTQRHAKRASLKRTHGPIGGGPLGWWYFGP